MLKDKDIAGVAGALTAKIDVWLTASINLPRGAAAGDVVGALKEAGAGEETIQSFPDPAAAYAFACEHATGNDRICVFGSFHTVAEVLRYRNVVEHG